MLQRDSIHKQHTIVTADRKERERNALKDMEDIQAGNPEETGHTGAGIKPGDRYDRPYNAHPSIGCCDRGYNVRPPLGFPRCCWCGQPNPSPLLLSFFMFTVCFSFLSVLPFFLAMKRFYLLHNVVDSKDSVQISVFAHLPPRGLII